MGAARAVVSDEFTGPTGAGRSRLRARRRFALALACLLSHSAERDALTASAA
jgi:hypothetical protein